MKAASEDGFINYSCHRKGEEQSTNYRYQGKGNVQLAKPGSLEFFLLERYLLFSTNPQDELFCGQVYHTPYPFQNVEVPEWSKEPLIWNDFHLDGPPISALYSKGVDVQIHPIRRLRPFY